MFIRLEPLELYPHEGDELLEISVALFFVVEEGFKWIKYCMNR